MPPRYVPLDIAGFTAGYWPGQPIAGPGSVPNSIYRGNNYWLRTNGRLIPVKGPDVSSSVNLGTRIYPLDIYRGEIAGGLVSGRLPKESLVRYQQSALFYVSENTSQQVYINESTSTPFTLTGVTTSATAGRLKVALLSGTTYTAYDAGLDAPASIGTVSIEAGGTKSMDGITSIVACARRITTDTTSNPSPANVQTLSAGGNNRFRVVLAAAATGQDGWLFGGSAWGSGNFGPWKVIREVRITLEGTFSFTNGAAAFTGTGSRLMRDARVGDRIRVDGSDYYIATITSDTAGTLTTNFTSATNSYTATMREVVLDYRNGELGEMIDNDNDIPPLLDGVAIFNNLLFGWRGNTFYPAKIGNPESFPRGLARATQAGGDIIHALAGDGRIYLLTTNGLEVVNFTANEADPFLIRQVWSFGFSSPTQAVVADGRLYAAVGNSTGGVKIVRTQAQDDPDLEFGAQVESDMTGWNISQLVLAVDPANAAVLAMRRDGSSATTVIPYMFQQATWGPPQSFSQVSPSGSGQVFSAATVQNSVEMIVYNGTNYRRQQFEGGNGSGTAAYVVTSPTDKDGLRQVIKFIKFTGQANTLYVYAGKPGAAFPDVTSTGAASAGPFTLTGTLGHETVIRTNVPDAQSFCVRVDSSGASANVSEIGVFGLINQITR